MTVSRRRLFQSLALTVGCSATVEADEPAISLDTLRKVSAANGRNLSDDRLRVIQPVLEQRIPRLQSLRDFEVEDAVAPTQGIKPNDRRTQG
jgi:hypothetical protein